VLTREDNELLTRVGPGTPCGELMRRYWHPILPEAKLRENTVQKVTILCEELVLYRDRKGALGLIAPRCPHRAVHLQFGIPEHEGLRCPYHGWMFDETGRCVEQPLEPPDSTFKEKIRITSYPVQEMGGLIWAYLGPAPVPLLPRWDLFAREPGFRQITGHWLPCNWLQVMENRGDLGHAIYLHGRLFQYALERKGTLTDDAQARYNATMRQQGERLGKGVFPVYRPIYNEFGFTKGTRDSDQSVETPSWRYGVNPILFPYLLGFMPYRNTGYRKLYQCGVPIDDTTTWHFSYNLFDFPPEVEMPRQEFVPYYEVPLTDESGEHMLDYVLAQDMVAWYAQGEIADRTKEHLGVSDRNVLEYRKLLKREIGKVKQGGEPINVFWDAAKADRPELRIPGMVGTEDLEFQLRSGAGYYRSNYHKVSKGGWIYLDDDVERYCPDRDLIVEMYRKADELAEGNQRAQVAQAPVR